MNSLAFFKFIEQHYSTNIDAVAEHDSEHFCHESPGFEQKALRRLAYFFMSKGTCRFR
jgi:hypothetical protein